MWKLLLILLLPITTVAQSASQFRQVIFSNLGQPTDNSVRYVVDGAVDPVTGNCLGSGNGAYAFRVQTGPSAFVWRCSTFAPASSGGGVSSVSANNSVSGLTMSITSPTAAPIINLSGVPNIAASNVTSGVLNPARLGTGTPNSSNFLRGDGTWASTGAGLGSVTSVALSLPNVFSVSGSPITTSGTLTAMLATQSANNVFAGPTTGSAATPAFRALVAADIPSLDTAKLTSGTIATARLGSGSASSSTCLRGDSTWATCATGTPAGSAGQFQFNNTTFGGATNFTYTSATGQVTANQLGNGNNVIYGKRVTDTGPTGNLIFFQNQAGSSNLFKVDVSGNAEIGGDLTLNSASADDGTLKINPPDSAPTAGGSIQLTTGTKPSCNTSNQFKFFAVAGGVGVKDSVEVCAKAADGTFAWRTIY